jgi:aspartate-semialdehyde dehydrogenase
MRIVVVGATGAVGTEVLKILEQRGHSKNEVVPVASARSAGRKLSFAGRTIVVEELAADVFRDGDLAIFDVPDEVSAEWVPVATERGALVIDKSAAWRMHDQVPLVVPEVNPDAAQDPPIGIIANPNCTTLAMVVPLAPLHRAAGLNRLVLASYQAASGSGKPGIDELWDQTELVVKEPEQVREGLGRDVLEAGSTFSEPIAMNVIPQCGSVKEDGYTSEELKLCHETRKIMGLPELRATATCVRVPVMVGHAVAVHATFDRDISPDEARSLLKDADGVALRDDVSRGIYPTPLEAAGQDPCYVGRIRQDPWEKNTLEMFCVADNLRKGAALNAVQIAELILQR